MHISVVARNTPDKAAIIDAATGVALTFKDLDERSNRVAHLLRSLGLRRGDHIAFMLENGFDIYDITFAALRVGMFVTPISTRLRAAEVAYLLRDSASRAFFISARLAEKAAPALDAMAGLHAFSVGGPAQGFADYADAVSTMPITPVADESTGLIFYYSSGSTGLPKGIVRQLPTEPLHQFTASEAAMASFWQFGPDTVYLHPSPLYHAAPLQHSVTVMLYGGTYVLMRDFDPEASLAAIERYRVTLSQWVPTMFIRMLRLPQDNRDRYDLRSHGMAIHAAAPCPVDIKHRMIAWWGPIVHEYYAASEGNGMCRVGPDEWLAKPGTVGRPVLGVVHIVDDAGKELPAGSPGTIYFAGGGEFQYHNDEEKTRSVRHPLGWTTVGDVGYLDEDGYLFLTDRVDFMIISGGVNIYPAEAENVLHAHPAVVDVAVVGVPNPDFGEEVKAIVQPADMAMATPALEADLIRFCRERIADVKCPRSVDFVAELPRLPTGKLQKKLLRAPYWADAAPRTKATESG